MYVCMYVCGVRGQLPPRGEPWERTLRLNVDQLLLRIVWSSPDRCGG